MDMHEHAESAGSGLSRSQRRNTYGRLMRLKREYRARSVESQDHTPSTFTTIIHRIKFRLSQICGIVGRVLPL